MRRLCLCTSIAPAINSFTSATCPCHHLRTPRPVFDRVVTRVFELGRWPDLSGADVEGPNKRANGAQLGHACFLLLRAAGRRGALQRSPLLQLPHGALVVACDEPGHTTTGQVIDEGLLRFGQRRRSTLELEPMV